MSLSQEFAAFIEEFKARRPAPARAAAAAPKPIDRDGLVARLAILQAEYDPSAQFSESHAEWRRHEDIRAEIARLRAMLSRAAMVDNQSGPS